MLPDVVDIRYQVGTSPWWSAVVRRYKTRAGPGRLAGVAFSGLVTPVIDIDRLVDRTRLASIVFQPAADGNTTVGQVPAGKRWELQAYRIEANSTGTYNRRMVLFNETAALAMAFEAVAAATVATYRQMGCRVTMDSGWSLGVNVDTWVAAGAAHNASCLVIESDMADDRTALLPSV